MNPTTTSVTPQTALERLADALTLAATTLYGSPPPNPVAFEPPRRAEHGDFATNVAFSYAKIARKPPAKIAEDLAAHILASGEFASIVASIEPVAGFINVRLAATVWQPIVADILAAGDAYGRGSRRAQLVSLEFGSANPTGPLLVVQGRALSIGSTLANALRFAGYDVVTEWIINDAGSQMETLGRSVYARYRQLDDPLYHFPEDGYPADYVVAIASDIREREGDRWADAPEAQWLPYFSRFARDRIVEEQKEIARRFRARNDVWTSERDELHDAGKVEAGIEALRHNGYVYELDGATWVRAAALGDDKDRVIIRSDGRPTYFAADIAYHWDKFMRGADHIVDILGPDHHGYIGRLQALAKAFGREGKIEVVIAQQVTLMRGDEKVSSSKRAGNILALEEVMEEVGVDAARFFFCMLSPEQPLTFDMELAKKQSDENPVYYVQYGHARIASVIRKAPPELLAQAQGGPHLDQLTHPAELTLIRRLSQCGSLIDAAGAARAPHWLTRYAREVAADFHQFYTACIILGDDAELSAARLALALATRQVLRNLLGILGVEARESM